MLVESLRAAGLGDRTADLLRQADLVAAGCGDDGLLASDITDLHDVYQRRLGPTSAVANQR